QNGHLHTFERGADRARFAEGKLRQKPADRAAGLSLATNIHLIATKQFVQAMDHLNRHGRRAVKDRAQSTKIVIANLRIIRHGDENRWYREGKGRSRSFGLFQKNLKLKRIKDYATAAGAKHAQDKCVKYHVKERRNQKRASLLI